MSLGRSIRLGLLGMAAISIAPETSAVEDADPAGTYLADSVRPRSLLFETPTNHYPGHDTSYRDQPYPDQPPAREADTLELPEKTVKPGGCDSFCREFRKYWTQVEEQDEFDKLRSQMRSVDIDKTRIPHFYLFDSNLVIFPGWFIIRKKR